MLRKFKEFEDSILRLLQYKLKVEEEREVSESENEQILDEMKNREKAHQDELEVIRDEYDKEYREWEKIVNNHDMKDTEYANLMMELNKGVLGDNYGNTTKNLKKKQIGDIVRETINKIKDMESSVSGLFTQLEHYENENDTILFYQIVNWRKNQNKENKQAIAKLKLEQLQSLKQVKAEERFNRIVVQSRKTEPPFHMVKKKKQVVLDTEEIKRENDKDLINY